MASLATTYATAFKDKPRIFNLGMYRKADECYLPDAKGKNNFASFMVIKGVG